MTTAAPLLGKPLSVEFMNTVYADREGSHDALDTSEGLTEWLEAALPREAGAISESQLDRFRRTRDAVRVMAAIATDDPRIAGAPTSAQLRNAVSHVNNACALAPTWLSMTWDGSSEPTSETRSSKQFPDTALSTIAEDAIRLFTGPDRELLRPCVAPGCVLYFVRNHGRREWCSAGCGNRARVARHYQRGRLRRL